MLGPTSLAPKQNQWPRGARTCLGLGRTSCVHCIYTIIHETTNPFLKGKLKKLPLLIYYYN